METLKTGVDSTHHTSDSAVNVQVDTAEPEVFIFPMSFAQERLWFLEQLRPGISAYNLPIPFRVKGALDDVALENALQKIVSRHEILRTTFDQIGLDLVQLVAPTFDFKLRKHDLRSIPDSERENKVAQLVHEEVTHSFDLQSGPLFRGTLYKVSDDDHVFLITMHHIVADGWSFSVILRELKECYESYSNGREPDLPELPIQYGDYAHWQKELSSTADFKSRLHSWNNKFADAQQLFDLPIAKPRPLYPSYKGSIDTLLLPDSLTQALKKLGHAQGSTLFLTTMAAFKTLLFRYTNEAEVVLGSPVANRTKVEIEDLVGCFVNTAIFRTQLSGDLTFAEVLSRVKEGALETYEYQDVPFEKIVEELQPERALDRNPLVQILFMCHKANIQPIVLPDISFSPFLVDRKGAQLDMTFYLLEREEGLRVGCDYRSDLFEQTDIRRFLEHYETLLCGIVADPDTPICELPLLREEERHQVLVEWNDTAVDYPKDRAIHQVFEEQVRRTPDAVAVVFGTDRMTYSELDRRANQIARHLRSKGVGREVLVGICLERSLEMIVGIMGILKAGGAYVPLDPRYPNERISLMLEDSEAAVLITNEKLVEGLGEFKGEVVLVDVDSEKIDQQPETDLDSCSGPNNLAYVIYTSGSTGKPKGVAIEHRSTVALISWARSVFDAGQLRGVLASTSICFDLSVYEIFAPLSCGGTIILAENVLQLPAIPAANEVTLINTVPSAITELLRIDGIPASVTTINLAGEPLKTSLVREIYELGTVEKVYDLYGPTEDTTYSTYTLRDSGKATIGRPISNAQAYILDRNLQPVPVGIPGELFLAGDGLARGYLKRRELTDERFVANPFSSEAGSRMYKTGDLARYLDDGRIEFIGRIDNQVKIRGFRIELGEIEAVLAAHPDVSEAVVIAREDNTGDKQLAAYFTANEDISVEVSKVPSSIGRKLRSHMMPSPFVQTADSPSTSNGKFDARALPSPDISFDKKLAARSSSGKPVAQIWSKIEPTELRSYLRQKLPDYMVPSAFVQLDRFPLTPNGKIDRKALPAPSDSSPILEESFIEPRDEVEEQLADVWKSVLGISRIGIKDNFFDLGGQSLLAVRLFAEIERKFGRNIPLASLFHASTIEQLARLIRTERSGDNWTSLVPINANGSKPPLFLMHAAGGNVLFYKDLAARLGPDQPCYGMQAVGLSGHQSAYDRIEDMAAHYIKEIRGVQPNGPYHLGGSSMGGLIAYEVGRQLRESGEKVNLIALFDTFAPGHPIPIPGRSRIGLKLLGHADRIKQHIDTLRILEPGRRWPYFVAKATKARNAVRRSYIKTKRKLARGILTGLGRPLPEALIVTQNLIAVATRTYRPKPFDGDLVLFRATKQIRGTYRDDTLGWSEFTKGKLEIHEINGAHGTIIVEPRVRLVVPILQQILGESEAAATESGANES